MKHLLILHIHHWSHMVVLLALVCYCSPRDYWPFWEATFCQHFLTIGPHGTARAMNCENSPLATKWDDRNSLTTALRLSVISISMLQHCKRGALRGKIPGRGRKDSLGSCGGTSKYRNKAQSEWLSLITITTSTTTTITRRQCRFVSLRPGASLWKEPLLDASLIWLRWNHVNFCLNSGKTAIWRYSCSSDSHNVLRSKRSTGFAKSEITALSNRSYKEIAHNLIKATSQTLGNITFTCFDVTSTFAPFAQSAVEHVPQISQFQKAFIYTGI